MKKFILSVFVLLTLTIASCAAEEKKGDKKPEAPLGFAEAELIGTVQEITMVNTDKNLQYWKVKVDGKPQPSFVFTDDKGKVGDRVIIYIVVRLHTGGAGWVRVRPLGQ